MVPPSAFDDVFESTAATPQSSAFDEAFAGEPVAVEETAPVSAFDDVFAAPIQAPVTAAETPVGPDYNKLRSETFKMMTDMGRAGNIALKSQGDSEGLTFARGMENTRDAIGSVLSETVAQPRNLFKSLTGIGDTPELKDKRQQRGSLNAALSSTDPAQNEDLTVAFDRTKDPVIGQFIDYFKGNGVTDGKQMSSILKDSAKANVWAKGNEEPVRTLSNGDLVFSPVLAAGKDISEVTKAIDGAKVDDVTKANAKERLTAYRTAVAQQLNDQFISKDEGDYKEHVAAEKAKGVTDPAAIVYSWDGLDRGFITKNWDTIRDIGLEGGRGILNTVSAGVAGFDQAAGSAAKKIGADSVGEWFDAGAADATKRMDQRKVLSEYDSALAAARGENGAIRGNLKDIGSSVIQMAPMFVGGGAGRGVTAGLEGLVTAERAAAIGSRVASTGVYGWAGLQGFGSILSTAMDVANDKAKAEGRTLTDAERVQTVKDAQLPALENGFQTAILSKILGEGVERSALGEASAAGAKITIKDGIDQLVKRTGAGVSVKQALGELVPEMKAMVKVAKSDFTDEFVEEGLNQAIESVITKASVNPNLDMGQAVADSVKAAFQGGLTGAGLPAVISTLTTSSPEIIAARDLALQAAPAAPISAQAAQDEITRIEAEKAAVAPVTSDAPVEQTTPQSVEQVSTEPVAVQPTETTTPEVTNETTVSETPVAEAQPVEQAPQPSAREAILQELGQPKNVGFPDKITTPEGADIELLDAPDGSVTASIEVPQDQRGQGVATRAMQQLVDLSDRNGATVRLDVEPFGNERPMSKQQLTDFYSKFGFELQSDGQTMVRTPSTPQANVTNTQGSATSETVTPIPVPVSEVSTGTTSSTDTQPVAELPGTVGTPQTQTEAPVAQPAVVRNSPQVANTEATPAAQTNSAQDYSPEALQATFNLTPEQTTATDALVRALGLDTSQIQLKRGGRPGRGALGQETNRESVFNRRLATAKAEILADIASGDLPDTVQDFSELQDYVDANMYINDADRGADRLIGPLGKELGWTNEGYIQFSSELIDELNSWLASGRTDNPVLEQRNGKPLKGSMEVMENGKILLRGLTDPDVSTAIHELSHVARLTLLDRNNLANGISPADVEIAEDWAGATDGVWDRAAEEKFARGFEAYLRDGVAPTQALAGLFSKIGQWLRAIYQSVAGTPLDVQLTPEMRGLLDKLVSRNPVEVFSETPSPPLEETPAEPDFKTPELPEDVTGVKHAITDEERVKYGLPARIPLPAGTEADSWQAALDAETNHRLAGLPGTAGGDLVTDLMQRPRATTPDETALLLREKLTRIKNGDAAVKRLNDLPPDATDAERKTAAAQVFGGKVEGAVYEGTQAALQDILDVLDFAGSQAGKNLQARKQLIKLDYSPAQVVAAFTAAKNRYKYKGELNPKELKTAIEYAEKLAESEAQLALLTEENTGLKEVLSSLTADIDRIQNQIRPKDSKGRSALKKKLNPRIDAAKVRLAEQGVTFLAQEGESQIKVTASMLTDFSAIGAGWLVDKVYDLGDFTEKLVSTFGSWIAEHAETIFNGSRQIYNETASSIGAAPTPAQVVERIDAEQPLDRAEAWEVARAFAIEGKRGRNILDATFEALAPLYPELTRDQLGEMITGYGKVSYPSKEEIPKELSKMRSLEMAALKLRDVVAGKAPLRTGFQRGQTDAEIRAAEKEYREKFKGSGLQSSDPNTLASAQAAAKRRMSNEIEELQLAIDRGTTRTTTQTQIEYDAEALALKSQLEAKRAEYDAIFGNEMTPEKRAAETLKALDRQIAEEDKMLRDGVLKRPQAERMQDTPEIAEKRRVLAEKRQNRRDLYEAQNPGQTALVQAKAAAQRSIERLKSVLANGDVGVKERKIVSPDAELAAMWEAREALQDEVAELRRALPLTPAQERQQVVRALAQAEATTKRLLAKIESGDLSTTPAKQTAASKSASVQAMRELNKELNKELQRRRRELKPKLSPEQAAINRQLAAIQKRTADLERRLKEKDYYAEPKKRIVVNDPAVRRAQYENAKVKSELAEAQGKLARENAPLLKSLGFQALVVSNLLKSLKLGLDLGIFLRNVSTLTTNLIFDDAQLLAKAALPGKPGAAARTEIKNDGLKFAQVINSTVKATFSPEYEHAVFESVSNRENARYDKQGKMVYSPPFDNRLLQKEDFPRANAVEEWPWWIWPAVGVAKWGILGMTTPVGIANVILGAVTKPGLIAFDRAQRVVTNQMRAMAFDSAIEATMVDGEISDGDVAALGRAVMVGSGRGSTNIQKLEAITPAANLFLLSTRYYLSRIQALTLNPLWTSPNGPVSFTARKQIAKMYGKSIATRATFYALTAMAFGMKWGDDDEEDKKKSKNVAFEGLQMNPLRTDFGNLTVNGVSVDFTSGLNSFATHIARLVTRRSVDRNGKETRLDPKYSKDITDEAIRFWGGKRNIALALVWDTHKGAFYGGEKVTFQSTMRQATEMVMFNDTVKIFEALGPAKGSALWALMFTGAGTRVFDSPDADAKRKAQKMQQRLDRAKERKEDRAK